MYNTKQQCYIQKSNRCPDGFLGIAFLGGIAQQHRFYLHPSVRTITGIWSEKRQGNHRSIGMTKRLSVPRHALFVLLEEPL